MYKIILASNSPRRKELLAGLDVPFEVRVINGIDESYPASLPTDELVITADTIVVLDDEVMGKPHDEADACRMLHELSGHTHQVITGVTLTTTERQQSFSVLTDVTFKQLSDDEINYYVTHYRPFDKAGSYGIQEWIGYVGVTQLNGSYFNVMGLPVQRIYEVLRTWLSV